MLVVTLHHPKESKLSLLGTSSRPQFVENLKNITVPIGREAIFSCNVRHLAPFKVNLLSCLARFSFGGIANDTWGAAKEANCGWQMLREKKFHFSFHSLFFFRTFFGCYVVFLDMIPFCFPQTKYSTR